MRQFSALAGVLGLCACTQFPELDATATPGVSEAPYPELLPHRLHQEHLYSSEKEFYEKIVWGINNYNRIRSNNPITIAEKFDWGKMAPFYDKIMKKLNNTKNFVVI